MARPTYFSRFRKQVLLMRAQGESTSSIAGALGTTKPSVIAALKSLDDVPPHRTQPYSEIMRDAPSILVSALWRVGCDTADMAKVLHIPEAHIATILGNVRERDRVALREAA